MNKKKAIIIGGAIILGGLLGNLIPQKDIPEPTPIVQSEQTEVKTIKEDRMFNKPGTVRNDKTGNCRLVRTSAKVEMEDYITYYHECFQDDTEIHALVNTYLGTTSRITISDNTLYVDIHEHIDKEELDANKLFTGMLLETYTIDIESGVITKIY